MLRIMLFCSLLFAQNVWATVENSAVKIFVTKSQPDYQLPWQTKKISRSSGSGVYVRVHDQNYILTSAHVISHATFIEVRKSNNTRKYPADVKWVSNETDLALLALQDSTFFTDIDPLSLGTLPKMGDQVTALGYPMGGDELSTTQGVVSRLEHRHYSFSKKSFLTIQIDTPINPGNSGGPIINQHNQIVGLAMQTITKANNISYLVPSRVIRHFFDDIADGEYQGMPNENFVFSLPENAELRAYFQLPEKQSGVLIEKVAVDTIPLQENDLLTHINGKKIENDGTVFLPEGKLSFKELIHQKQIGETLLAKVLRDGKELEVSWKLSAEETNLPTYFSDKPQYHLFGGLILVPLSQNILASLVQSGSRGAIMTAASLEEYATLHPEKKEIVVLQRILPNNQNAGYRASYSIIESFNDQPVADLQSLIKTLEKNDSKWVKFKTHDDQTFILNKRLAQEGDKTIRSQYGI
ncbi:S1C family serine protease [Thiomicrorhabdus heinhorstiae]|uniref:Trypsin-like peptidase domain-containing protein n=1 Tax=Thiomicrorhabdus heinhorstiae TaxID=2748010 RepID=A0ABS0BU26_9GAMM|nr:trypsin-like peptidase domain-containing protein [Thiomicrorhabdus heinhorstiae]MBF6057341.1 trypsin-like peptidase domain-containing protein [Thiomicrorhabdus heinhorstiae]